MARFGGHLNPDYRRWLEADHNLTLRAKRFDESLASSGYFAAEDARIF
jgi:hypothetical protein